jgi:outer membrane phospholipase A
MGFKTTEFDKSMLKKGFTNEKSKRKNNNHLYFYLEYPSGQHHLNIRTWHSVHSDQKNISDDIISYMAKQLHFDNKKDLEKYIECTYSLETYIKQLKEKKLI